MIYQFIGAGYDVNDDVYNERVEFYNEWEARIYFNDELDDKRYIHQVLIETHDDGRWMIIDQVCTEGKIVDWFVTHSDGNLSVVESNLQKVLKKRL